jgi:hypothetical protein
MMFKDSPVLRTPLYRKSNLCITGKELRVLSPNSYIHVSVSYLYISRIGPHIWLLQNLAGTVYECMNRETEHYNSVLEITRLHSFISGNT